MQDLLKEFRQGNRRALAKIISQIENERPGREYILKNEFHSTGKAKIIGFTGSPGVGKSSLIDNLVNKIRKNDETVGIVAVDPTSPFTGGALLGDRIRMQNHSLDKDIFIRSMGTRGSLGGLARNSKDVVKIMDAFGKDWIIVETVGVGQAEVDIINIADCIVVILTPNAGDSIQTMKAGIMEIADIFVVNKCDLPGVDRIVTEIETMLSMHYKKQDWLPPIVKTSSSTDEGIDELFQTINKHYDYLQKHNILKLKQQEKEKTEVLDILHHQWKDLVQRYLDNNGSANEVINKVMRREIDPYSGASEILKYIIKSENFSDDT